MAMANASNTTAPTQFIQTKLEKYAYRRFGKGPGLPLLCLQHFTGTLDNWDPAVTDPLALGREVILFESAGLGRSTGQVPENMAGMAAHALAFVDAVGLKRLDILGYSLGGMVAQQVALERPSLVHKMLLVATAPEGGEDIMHMDKPELRKITEDPDMPGLEKLVKLFFARSESSQAAGEAFAARLGEIKQACLVVNGVFDNMIPVRNSYMLSEHLPNAMLLTYPDAGHGSLFQFYKSFVRQATLFLNSESLS